MGEYLNQPARKGTRIRNCSTLAKNTPQPTAMIPAREKATQAMITHSVRGKPVSCAATNRSEAFSRLARLMEVTLKASVISMMRVSCAVSIAFSGGKPT